MLILAMYVDILLVQHWTIMIIISTAEQRLVMFLKSTSRKLFTKELVQSKDYLVLESQP